MTEIENKIIQLIQVYQKDGTELSLNCKLRDDLQLDSLSMTELIVACEDEFNLEIDVDDQEILQVKTIKDLANYMKTIIDQNEVN